MDKYREILRKLVAELEKQTAFPAYIGREPKVMRCSKMGTSFRVSGFLGGGFPPEVLEITGATQNEVREAFDWVTCGSPELFEEKGDTFFAFIPMDEKDWAKK